MQKQGYQILPWRQWVAQFQKLGIPDDGVGTKRFLPKYIGPFSIGRFIGKEAV